MVKVEATTPAATSTSTATVTTVTNGTSSTRASTPPTDAVTPLTPPPSCAASTPSTNNNDTPTSASATPTCAQPTAVGTTTAAASIATTTTTIATAVINKEKAEEEEVEEENTADEPSSAPEQVHISTEQLALLSKEELVEKWLQQDKFVESIQSRMEAMEREVEELRGARENEERLKGQLAELQRKEQYHIMRLSCKEHELQDMGVQVQELKSMSAGVGGFKHCLLDPAVNLLFERLKRDLDSARTKMEETQNELSAWKFTPDSNTGKQLMAKCRLLIKENEELGRMITSGRLAKLEGELALQRNFSEELKKSQSELDEFLLEMDEDTEGMQGTIYYLQQQLRQAKERITQLNAQLALTQTPDTQPTDDSSAQVISDVGSELNNEAEQTEETTLVPQPNGDASHDEPQINSESSDLDTTAATPLTNGRKRTQSEIEEGAELTEGVTDTGEIISGAEGVPPPQKRTRTDGEEEIVGGEESTVPVVENGVLESE